jgi:hypothetical protein
MSSAQPDMPLTAHLTPEQIVACRDGELELTAAHQHLALCPLCKARLAEARFLAALIGTSLSKSFPLEG